MVNRVILIGNLGKDPEVRRLENGAVVAKFSIATNENYKDRSGEWQTLTEWHDIVAWRSLAERAESGLKKGDAIYVEGKLTHRSWQDQDGNNRRTTEVVANYFRVISKREGTGGGNAGGGYFPSANDEMAAPASVNNNGNQKQSQEAPPQPEATADDDLPF
jgi:single-strand DNA-binding protein